MLIDKRKSVQREYDVLFEVFGSRVEKQYQSH